MIRARANWTCRTMLASLLTSALAVSIAQAAEPAGSGAAAGEASADAPVQSLICEAGNAYEERDRYELLQKLAAMPNLDADLRKDLEALLPIVDQWANGKDHAVVDTSRAAENGYLCRFITNKVKPEQEGKVYPPPPSEGSPLRPIWAYYRGRMLVWRVVQSGPLLRVEQTRNTYYGEARGLLEEARWAFPENRIIGMYLGQPIPWPKRYAPSADAPEWANLQREGLEKLTDVIHWWIDERQLPDGQFGGGWGDDVEMWRWWTPLLVGFEDPKINAAQARISAGIFEQPHLKAGFTSRMTDVEHSNEDTTDTILPMMHLAPDDPLWRSRALTLAELMRNRWTGRNQRGFLQFRSIYFNVDRVDESPQRAFDTVYHPAIVQPALLYWQRTKDPALTELFGEWLKVWIDATARAENGKPAGVLPSTIHWPEGTIAAADKPWWEPFSLGHNDALYNWPGASRLMACTLLLAYHITGEEQYLEPLRSMAAIRLKHAGSRSGGEPGSEAWCARKMDGFLSEVLAKYRFLTGDTQYDRLLRSDASGYARFRLSSDRDMLVRDLRRTAEAFRSNWEGYTSEMRWTDRVLAFSSHYLSELPTSAPPSPSPGVLYNSATGDPGGPLVLPLNAVRWRTPAREIAALVTDSGRERFGAELFHFGSEPRRMAAQLHLLEPGRYTWMLKDANSRRIVAQGSAAADAGGAEISFELPPKRLCVIEVKRGQ